MELDFMMMMMMMMMIIIIIITCSKLTIETLEQGVKYVQSYQ